MKPEPQDNRPLLVQQHLAYWVLEISDREHHFGHQNSEIYLKNSYEGFKEKWHDDYTGYAIINLMAQTAANLKLFRIGKNKKSRRSVI